MADSADSTPTSVAQEGYGILLAAARVNSLVRVAYQMATTVADNTGNPKLACEMANDLANLAELASEQMESVVRWIDRASVTLVQHQKAEAAQ